jgi:hypothetical protein
MGPPFRVGPDQRKTQIRAFHSDSLVAPEEDVEDDVEIETFN